jgi:glyoxylase-like metal-dependent hydrolase (beta-lactamase superfamily II)
MKLSIAIFVICAFVGSVHGQADTAAQVLTRAIDKLGGEAKVRSFKSIYYSAKGFENGTASGQADDPERPSNNPHEERLAVFNDGRRLAYELKTARGDGTTRFRRFFFTDTRRIVADFGTRSASAAPVRFPSVDRDQDARRIPHAFLLEVLANASQASLRSDGDHQVVSLTLPNAKIPVSLYFDGKTSLLSKYEYAAEVPALGLSNVEYLFDDYRPHDQLGFFPTAQTIKINGNVWRSIRYGRVLVDSPEADAMLEIPEDMAGFIAAPGEVKEVAKGVFFVYGVAGFYPMFVEFRDFILAIEAPSNYPSLEETPLETFGNMNAASEQFLAKIKATIPNKPIRFVATTHAHSDHMGGLRVFAGERATVLTTPGNDKFYRRFVPGMSIETVRDKRTISDGERSVELISVGRNPHTAENLIAWMPKEKIIYQGDLFYFSNEATFPIRDRMTVMPFFAKWLKEQRIEPERIYGLHGPMFGTMDHINRILKMESAQRQGVSDR